MLDAFNDSFNADWNDIEDRLSKLKKFSEDRSHSREEKRLRKPGGTCSSCHKSYPDKGENSTQPKEQTCQGTHQAIIRQNIQ